MNWYETDAFGAPLEELQEKHGVGPQLQVFLELELLELDAFDMTRWWSFWSGALETSPPATVERGEREVTRAPTSEVAVPLRLWWLLGPPMCGRTVALCPMCRLRS